MNDNSTHETTNVVADKIEKSAIGKKNKVNNLNIDGIKIVVIIFAIVVSLLLVVAGTAYVMSKGEINMFPAFEFIFKLFIPFFD